MSSNYEHNGAALEEKDEQWFMLESEDKINEKNASLDIVVNETDLYDVTTSTNKDMMELRKREQFQPLKQQDVSFPVDASTDQAKEGNDLQEQGTRELLTKQYAEQWFSLEELKSSLKEVNLEKKENSSPVLSDNMHCEAATDDLSNDDVVETNHEAVLNDNYDQQNGLGMEARMSFDTSAGETSSIEASILSAMERPEPLGKAKVESDSKKTANKTTLTKTALSEDAAVNSASSLSTETSINVLEMEKTEKNDFRDDDSDSLKEQAYPVRVPLSLPEARSISPKDASSETGDESTSSYQEIETKQVNTPITSLLGPSYKSSIVLLEELKRRRFRNADDNRKDRTENIDAASKKQNNEQLPEATYQDSFNPMKLAENAMKASKMLSSQTEKSLKRANQVLQAVQEHRTPPDYSSYSNLNSFELDSKSLSKVSREVSFSSTGASTVSYDGADRRSKDSIDRLIEKRIFAGNSDSSATSSVLSSSNELKMTRFKAKTDKLETASSDTPRNTSKDSSLESLNTVYSTSGPGLSNGTSRGKLSFGTLSSGPSSTKLGSSLDDVTSSELMRLKSFGEDFNSPYFVPNFSKLKLDKVEEISPIQQHIQKSAIEKSTFRSSSRKHELDNKGLNGRNFSDSDIVQLHRSLGAGTVTPLLPEYATAVNMKDNHNTNSEEDKSQLSTNSYFKQPNSLREDTVKTTMGLKKESLGKDSGSSAKASGAENESKFKSYNQQRNSLASRRSELVNIDERSNEMKSQDSEVLKKYNQTKYPTSHAPVKEFANEIRGIYDVRDSSGPGSTNRKRRNMGKAPVSTKEKMIDRFNVYVSEDSKSSLKSSNNTENERLKPRQFHLLASKTGVKTNTDTNHINIDDEIEASSSSMLSQSPVLSRFSVENSDDSQLETNVEDNSRKHNNSFQMRKSLQKTKVSLDELDRKREVEYNESNRNHMISIPNQKPTSKRFASADDIRWQAPYKNQQNINELWQKFQQTFAPKSSLEQNDLFQKIDALTEIINDQGIETPVQPSKRNASEPKSSNGTEFKQLSRHSASGVKKIHTSKSPSRLRVTRSGKRDMGTNCPTPVPSDLEIEAADFIQPLLIDTWTQTTPWQSKQGQLSRNFAEGPGATKVSPNNRKMKLLSGKENSQYSANMISPSKAAEKDPLSWNVKFEEKQSKEKQNGFSRKPPVFPNSKLFANSQQDKIIKKQREPVFTAWFQSTRSDTSSGTVVPLSDVPKLANAYKEKKQAIIMHTEPLKTRETESVVRVGLQEAFQFAKEDFIRRSKERVERVKNLKFHKQKRSMRHLKERNLEEAVVMNPQSENHPTSADNLYKSKKRQIDRKEMFERNKRMYDRLPEVVKKREEESRKAQFERNRILMKQFDKKLRNHLTKKKRS